MELSNILKARHSVRKFSKKKPDWRRILECVDNARFTPMAGNIYTPKFILVYDRVLIEKLAIAAQQPFVGDVHYVLVVCSLPTATLNAYGDRGKMYFRHQAGAVIQNLLLSLTEKGIATCWVGHFVESQVKKILGIPDEVYVEALLPLGYEFEKQKAKKPKIPLDNIIYFNKYKNKQMREKEVIDA